MKNFLFKYPCAALITLALLGASPEANAGETSTPNIDVHVTTGVRALPHITWGFIPMPPSAAVAADINRLRIRADLSAHLEADIFHGTLGAGYVFIPTGRNAATAGGFQLKLPLTIDVGLVKGTPEAGDGYSDSIFWLLVGPSIGADVTWWKADSLGFCISLKVGYQIKGDLDSEYADGYSYAEDKIGLLDLSVLLGVVF